MDWLLLYYWDDLRAAGITALASIADKCNAFSEWWNSFTDGLGNTWEVFVNRIKGIWDNFVGGVKAVTETVSGWGDKLDSLIPDTMPRLSKIAGNKQTNNDISISANVNVNGAQSPQATAEAVANEIRSTASWDGIGANSMGAY